MGVLLFRYMSFHYSPFNSIIFMRVVLQFDLCTNQTVDIFLCIFHFELVLMGLFILSPFLIITQIIIARVVTTVKAGLPVSSNFATNTIYGGKILPAQVVGM